MPFDSLTPSGIDLHNGNIVNTTDAYDGSSLAVTLVDMATGKPFTRTYAGYNIAALVGGSMAYVGFTGGTGAWTATQDILSWTFKVTA
jgi:hypothetical protein